MHKSWVLVFTSQLNNMNLCTTNVPSCYKDLSYENIEKESRKTLVENGWIDCLCAEVLKIINNLTTLNYKISVIHKKHYIIHIIFDCLSSSEDARCIERPLCVSKEGGLHWMPSIIHRHYVNLTGAGRSIWGQPSHGYESHFFLRLNHFTLPPLSQPSALDTYATNKCSCNLFII